MSGKSSVSETFFWFEKNSVIKLIIEKEKSNMDIGMNDAACRAVDEWNHSREMDGKKSLIGWMDLNHSRQMDGLDARMGKDP